MSDLRIDRVPEGECPVMILGFTGWMDGGRVSTATVGYLREKLGAQRFAAIDSGDFQIFNFPVSTLPITVFLEDEGRAIVAPVSPMESAAAFRPHIKIVDGRIEQLVFPQNRFFVAEGSGIALFSGEEPHIRWRSYADCMFEVATNIGVRHMIFAGSVAGPVPHTRKPRIRSTVTDDGRRAELAALGIEFTNYEGPSSIVTALARRAPDLGIEFTSLVVEIPHYPFIEMPTYPRSIASMATVLNSLLGQEIGLTDLHEAAGVVDRRLSEVMAENDEFAQLVAKLEEAYEYESSGADETLLRQLIESIDIDIDHEGDHDRS